MTSSPGKVPNASASVTPVRCESRRTALPSAQPATSQPMRMLTSQLWPTPLSTQPMVRPKVGEGPDTGWWIICGVVIRSPE
jgi:hypothetical protein